VYVIGEIARWSSLPEWRDTVTIIQLLNEPVLWDDYNVRLGRLKDYYGLAYHEVRKYNPDVVVAVHDAFIGAENWFYFNELEEYHTVMLDIHMYQVFGDEWRDLTCVEHGNYPCTYHERLTTASQQLLTIVGEWSIATPGEFNCNGQDFFASQQIAAFEEADGWFMWAHFNGNNMQEWSFRHSYENGWINPAGNNERQCDASATTPATNTTLSPSPNTTPPPPTTTASPAPPTTTSPPPPTTTAEPPTTPSSSFVFRVSLSLLTFTLITTLCLV